MKQNLISSILAGLSIAIGAMAFLNTENLIFGAFMFSIGLVIIMLFNLNLYTGKISYINFTKEEIKFILIVLLGNILGNCILFFFPNPSAILVVAEKLSAPIIITFIEAILCNILIYVAIESYKIQKISILFLSIAAFILAGFEHSIANIAFVISARYFNFKVLFYLIITIIGNAVGGILFHRIIKKYLNKEV